MSGRACRHCSAPLKRKSRNGPWPRYCSASCRARACDLRARADGREAEWDRADRMRKRSSRLRSLRSVACAHCAVEFTPLRRGKRYCTRECVNAAFGARRRATAAGRAKLTDYQRTRVARAKGATELEPIIAALVFERDDWTCGLCHEPIQTGVPKRHPLSPSLDHIVPLSLGGQHTHDNVQAAHLICNGRKGNRLTAAVA